MSDGPRIAKYYMTTAGKPYLKLIILNSKLDREKIYMRVQKSTKIF